MMMVFSLVLVSVVTRHGVGDVDRNIYITVAYVEERGGRGAGGGGGGEGEERGRSGGEGGRGEGEE